MVAAVCNRDELVLHAGSNAAYMSGAGVYEVSGVERIVYSMRLYYPVLLEVEPLSKPKNISSPSHPVFPVLKVGIGQSIVETVAL